MVTGERGSDDERRNFVGSGNDAFTCTRCGARVLPLEGGFRSHCPRCLWSRHVDLVPGDRGSSCGGPMRPIELEQRGSVWYVVHQCERCGFRRPNHLSLDDRRQPDRWDAAIEVTSGRDPAEGLGDSEGAE